MKRIPQLDKRLRDALEETGLPWSVTQGKRHKLVRLNGALVCILPNGAITERSQHAVLNARAQIRRSAKEMKNAQDQAAD